MSPLRDRVIFVVGARRSGTNWLQRIIAAHPNVVAVPSETYLFSEGLRPLRERFHQGALSSGITGFVYADRDAMLDAMRDLADTVFNGLITGIDPSAARIVERTPDHVRHLDLIAEVYPDAHVVHIVRDGRDVVRSLLSHEWGPDDARAATLEWRTAIEAARDAAPKLEHYTELSYEAALADPAMYARKIFDVVGLPASDTDIAAVLAEMGTRYNADPNAPAIEIGKWRTGLSPEILAVVEETAGDLLEDLGYERSDGAASSAPVATKARKQRRLRSPFRKRITANSPEQQLIVAHHILDLFLDAAANDPSEIDELLTPVPRVRIVDGEERYEARGDEAKEHLVAELGRDAVLRGPQTMGYIHPSTQSVTFVGEFSHDGKRHPRVFALTLHGEQIERVAYYRFEPIDA